MPNGDIYEVTFHCHHVSQRGIMRRFYQIAAEAGTGPTPAQMATRLDTGWGMRIRNCLVAGATYEGLKIARVHPVPRTRGTIDTTNNGVGSVAGDALPTQVRGLVTLRTDFAGPGYRGRMYVPFPSEAHNSPTGTPQAAYDVVLAQLAAQAALVETLVGVAPNQASMIPIIWHLPFGLPNLPQNRIPYQVREGVPRQRWATQRRSGTYGAMNVDEIT